ncbi:MAG TPA: HIT family protein [Chloroflexota bacterium]|jgi:diadenosine tetraphosphate (Ap4A) HIT family hydrolase
MSWMPREEWDALVRGDGCAMCRELATPDPENEHSFLVAELQMGRLRLAKEQHMPGWCVLVCRRHVREPHELSPDEAQAFFADLLHAGRALEEVYRADKLNYQILGNLLPHLHVHINPRHWGDRYPGGPVAPPAVPVYLTSDEYQTQIARIRAALGLE